MGSGRLPLDVIKFCGLSLLGHNKLHIPQHFHALFLGLSVDQHIAIIDLLNGHLLHMIMYCIWNSHVGEGCRTENMADCSYSMKYRTI